MVNIGYILQLCVVVRIISAGWVPPYTLHGEMNNLKRINIKQYQPEYEKFEFKVHVANARCISNHEQCNIIKNDKQIEKMIIYDLTNNKCANIPLVRCERRGCGNRSKRYWNPITHRDRLLLDYGDEVSVKEPLLKIGRIWITFRLCVYLNNCTRDDPTVGPSKWRQRHVQMQRANIIGNLEMSEQKIEYTEDELNEYIDQQVPSIYYYTLLYRFLFWNVWLKTKLVKFYFRQVWKIL